MWKYLNSKHDLAFQPLSNGTGVEVSAVGFINEPIALEDAPDPDFQAARQYAKLQALASMTPAQVLAWVQANVTNLATAQDAIATLAVAVSILARRI